MNMLYNSIEFGCSNTQHMYPVLNDLNSFSSMMYEKGGRRFNETKSLQNLLLDNILITLI